MYRIGQKEIDAVAKVMTSGELFRYHKGGECERFEKRYAEYLRVKHVCQTASGTHALTAALVGCGLGPGDEVIVPSHTYMATAIAVLAVGAIPIIVDIDNSLTLDPRAFEDSIGPRTRAVIPVHLWGLTCDMRAIMRIARKRKLLVIEDACQAVGGAYEGKMLGSIGCAGAFSFNYYKNMTCGEGGAVVTNDPKIARAAACAIDCCAFYWHGRSADFTPFTSNGARASEFEGAMLSAQLDRLPGMIAAMRRQKKRILKQTANTGLIPARANSLDYETGATVVYILPTVKQAEQFREAVGGTIAGKTGRHVYTEWDPILHKQGAHHPAINPFKLPQNRRCRMKYSKNMCPRSLDILNRAVMISTHPDRTQSQVTALIKRIRSAAQAALSV